MKLVTPVRERAVPLALSAALPFLAPVQSRFPFRPLEAIERAQLRRLRATVAHAHRHVPYYRETMRRLGLAPEDIATAADLAKLPVIERDDLQRDPEYFCSERHPPSECLEQRSGGSTGEPVTVFWDRAALVRGAAHRERQRRVAMALAGRRTRIREVRITLTASSADASSSPDASSRAAAMFARSSVIPSSVRVKRKALSLLDPPAENLPSINDFRPHVIITYGSYVEALFTHMLRTGKRLRGSPVIVFGADPLSASLRRMIAREFGNEVISVYQCVETSQIGFECERRTGFHQNLDLCAVRVLASSGEEAAPGSQGEAVVSNLVARGTVLLNYRLGDLVATVPEPCPCGRRLPLLSLAGRSRGEWIEAMDGARLHPQPFLKPLSDQPEVLRHQVVQLAPGRIAISIVPSPGADRERMRSTLEGELRELLGPGGSVSVEFTETLVSSATGKVKAVMTPAEGARLGNG